jgi:hypothetical protein
MTKLVELNFHSSIARSDNDWTDVTVTRSRLFQIANTTCLATSSDTIHGIESTPQSDHAAPADRTNRFSVIHCVNSTILMGINWTTPSMIFQSSPSYTVWPSIKLTRRWATQLVPHGICRTICRLLGTIRSSWISNFHPRDALCNISFLHLSLPLFLKLAALSPFTPEQESDYA